MSSEMLAAMSAVIGVIIAIIALIKQSRDTHLSLGVQLLRDFEKQFESNEMKEFRASLSKLYLRREKKTEISSLEILNCTDVLDFFETIGTFLKRNLLDVEFTWSEFSYWVIRYWEILEKDIIEYRKIQGDNEYWTRFEYLYKKLMKYDSKQLKIRQNKLAKTELQRFLREEAGLTRNK